MKHTELTVRQFYEQQKEALQMTLVGGEAGLDRIIREPTVNRPGLAMAGFNRYFAHKRIQVIGNAEYSFLRQLPNGARKTCYHELFRRRIPCVVYSRNLVPDKMAMAEAEEFGLPVFRTPQITMKFINRATLAMEAIFAPRGTEIGSMVDILGVGAIVRGESGIGKSESVLALIERGHSLVSDDITRVTLLDGKEIIGTSPELTRNLMEVRGIGIINVASLFGVKATRHDKRVDVVVTLKAWNDVSDVDRLGLDIETVQILGVEVPHMTIPVRPGRDLARLIEVAALQIKLRLSGQNPAADLDERLQALMQGNAPEPMRAPTNRE
jgi:HPr kinase/phosphorylase